MECAKKDKDPSAPVEPTLSNHEIYEKWRGANEADLGPVEKDERARDAEESTRRYDAALETVLSHSCASEVRRFWDAFGIDTKRVSEESMSMFATKSSGRLSSLRGSSVFSGFRGSDARSTLTSKKSGRFTTNPMRASMVKGAGKSAPEEEVGPIEEEEVGPIEEGGGDYDGDDGPVMEI